MFVHGSTEVRGKNIVVLYYCGESKIIIKRCGMARTSRVNLYLLMNIYIYIYEYYPRCFRFFLYKRLGEKNRFPTEKSCAFHACGTNLTPLARCRPTRKKKQFFYVHNTLDNMFWGRKTTVYRSILIQVIRRHKVLRGKQGTAWRKNRSLQNIWDGNLAEIVQNQGRIRDKIVHPGVQVHRYNWPIIY